MIKRSFKKLLKKYQSGQLDPLGTRFIETWYDQIGQGDEADGILNDEEKASSVRDAIHSNLIRYIGKKETGRKIFFWYYLAAAAVLLILSIGLFLQRQEHKGPTDTSQVFTTVTAAPGILKRIELPDHSEIWLNSGSRLRYSAQTFTQKREVFLDEGEALFTVVKNPEYPFSVRTRTLHTTVLGTSFNVKAYRELDYTAVQVKTGQVGVGIGQGQTTDTITAGQNIIYDKHSGKLSKNINVHTVADGWVKGVTVLNEATFKELSLVMYNRYQIRLKSDNPAVHRYHYTINIMPDKTMEAILTLLCATHQNKYRRNKNEVTIY